MTPENSILQPSNDLLVLRTVPLPSDLNVNGNVFGGWILSQMDLAGGNCAQHVAQGPVATIAIKSMRFHCPIEIGDIVDFYGDVERIGTTSITVKLDVFAEAPGNKASRRQVTEGRYVFVAIDDNGKPRAINAG